MKFSIFLEVMSHLKIGKFLTVFGLLLFSCAGIQAEVNWQKLRCGEYNGSTSSWNDVNISFLRDSPYFIMKWKHKTLKIFPQRERAAGSDFNVGLHEVKDQYDRFWTLVMTHTMDPEYFRFWLGRPNPNNPSGRDVYILCKDLRANQWG